MAEAAGLAVGTIALASLFQTCIEVLEYIDDARNIDDDRERGETKLSLLNVRLKQMGEDLHVTNPGLEDGGLPELWPQEIEAISNGLLGVTQILNNASRLCRKYDLQGGGVNPTPSRPKAAWQVHDPTQRPAPRRSTYCSLVSFRKRASWALRDKKRFNSLLTELDFFVTNLEKVCFGILKFGECRSLCFITISDYSR